MRRPSSVFEENHLFIEEEDNPSDNVFMVKEELDGTDIDGIGNLVDLPRLMFIDEEWGNLKVVLDGGELTRNDKKRKSSQDLQANRCSLCDKCSGRDWDKHDFLCCNIFLGRL